MGCADARVDAPKLARLPHPAALSGRFTSLPGPGSSHVDKGLCVVLVYCLLSVESRIRCGTVSFEWELQTAIHVRRSRKVTMIAESRILLGQNGTTSALRYARPRLYRTRHYVGQLPGFGVRTGPVGGPGPDLLRIFS